MVLRQETRDGYALDVPGIVPKLSATPGSVRSPAPHLGEDTDGILREIGYTAEDIAALRKKGTIG
jgi:formyl-CoA transferase